MSMDREALRQTVIAAVLELAPEADFSHVDPAGSLREQLDLDSYDFLNLLVALHEQLGVDIPEADYAKVDGLDKLLDYLVAKLG
jgi:acyl carrier protein